MKYCSGAIEIENTKFLMKLSNPKKIQVMMFAILLISSIAASGQTRIQVQDKNRESAQDRQQFRLAQQYQLAEKHEQAVTILKKLYQKHPGTQHYYNELMESLIALSRIDEALKLIGEQKGYDPTNPRYDIDYGSVLYQQGKPKEAKEIWKKALENHSNNVAIFTLVANAMLSHNLFDEAIEVYKKGFERHPKRTYFLQNIASIYRNRFQYKDAAEYYLEYLRVEPSRYHSIARQILTMDIDKDEVDDIADILKKEAKQFKDIPEFQTLTAKYYQKYQMFEEALKIYENLEDNNTQGKYLLDFGKTMQADSLYDLALRCYDSVINRFPKSPYLLDAYLGTAKCNLELAQLKNEQTYAQKAIAVINMVRKKYPNHPEVAELSLVEGLLYKKFFFDIDKSIEIFKDISETYGEKPEIFAQANLLLGECYLIRGDLEKAESTLKKIEAGAPTAQALYYLAKIEFYRGNYPNSLNYLNSIIQLEGASGTVTNDALELQLLISQAQSTPEPLQLYADADLLVFQQKKSQAVNKLENALKKNPPNQLKADMLLKAARLSREIGNPQDALNFCNEIITDSSMVIYADEALFVMATIFERDVKDLSQAYQLYDRLLVEFPDSRFSHMARARLSEIRGQVGEVMP